MTVYDNPFAEEVRENPHDDMPRLIFADYLDDNGDPLGQLIRIQVDLANMPKDDPRRTSLEQAERAIIAEHGEFWLEPLRAFGVQGISTRCFQRGLIERIRISAENFLLNGEAICIQSPALHILCLTGLDQVFRQFSLARLPEQIRGLDLSPCRLGMMETADMNWPQMNCIEQLNMLDLRMTNTTDQAIAQLCKRDLSNLRYLDVSVCGITAQSAQALSACATLANLETLKLSLNSISNDGLAAIARSPYLVSLKQLDVASNSITDEGAEAIARSGTLPALERLNLRANRISRRLAFPNVRDVDLRNNAIR